MTKKKLYEDLIEALKREIELLRNGCDKGRENRNGKTSTDGFEPSKSKNNKRPYQPVRP